MGAPLLSPRRGKHLHFRVFVALWGFCSSRRFFSLVDLITTHSRLCFVYRSPLPAAARTFVFVFLSPAGVSVAVGVSIHSSIESPVTHSRLYIGARTSFIYRSPLPAAARIFVFCVFVARWGFCSSRRLFLSTQVQSPVTHSRFYRGVPTDFVYTSYDSINSKEGTFFNFFLSTR